MAKKRICIAILLLALLSGSYLVYTRSPLSSLFAEKQAEKTEKSTEQGEKVKNQNSDQTEQEEKETDERSQPTQLTTRDKQDILVNYTLSHLPQKDLDNFDTFFERYQFAEDKRNIAALLYFYRNGFVDPSAYASSGDYMYDMLNFHPYGYLPIGKRGTQVYNSSLYNFSVRIPNSWRMYSFTLNNIAFLSPDTILESGDLYFYNEAFDIYFFKDCDANTYDEFVKQGLSNPNRQYPFRKDQGPLTETLGKWGEVTKYSFRAPKSSFPKETVGGDDIRIDDYFVNIEDKVFYQIYFKYSPSFYDTYRPLADKIIDSLEVEKTTCEEDFRGLGKDEIKIFYSSAGTLYDLSKSSQSQHTFR